MVLHGDDMWEISVQLLQKGKDIHVTNQQRTSVTSVKMGHTFQMLLLRMLCWPVASEQLRTSALYSMVMVLPGSTVICLYFLMLEC